MTQTWKKKVDEKVVSIATAGGIVLDVGGGKRFQKWLAEHESLFAGVDYKTFDYDASTTPDIVGDIHSMPIADNSIDAVICSSVLEHVRNPVRAMEEIYRILKPGGKLLLYVPSIHPYHARPGAYPDYWRIFDDTIRELCKPFATLEVWKRGGHFGALALFIPPQRLLGAFYRMIGRMLDVVLSTERRAPTTEGFYAYAVK